MLKAVAFVTADLCSHRQLKGNFAGSKYLMDLFKQTKCELSGSEEDFELEKDTCKGSAIVFSGEFQGDGEGVKSFTHFPWD